MVGLAQSIDGHVFVILQGSIVQALHAAHLLAFGNQTALKMAKFQTSLDLRDFHRELSHPPFT
jgi:hypothetical protein